MQLFALALCVLALCIAAGYSQELDSQGSETGVEDRRYGQWSAWTHCNRHCVQSRTKICQHRDHHCKGRKLKEKRFCFKSRGKCSKGGRERHSARGLQDLVYDVLYYDWSEWGACTRSCLRRRYRTCALKHWCKNTVLLEEEKCYIPGSKCAAQSGEDEEVVIIQQSQSEGSSQEDTSEFSMHNDRNDKNRGKLTESGSGSGSTPQGQLDLSQCGKRNVSVRSMRIVGGQQSQKGAWPWQVAILTRWKEQYCGGVLISPQHILTAAHCVRRRGKRRRVIIRVGDYDLSYSEGQEQEFRMLRDIVHPDFDIETIDSDIAIIRLSTPIIMSDHIKYACVPDVKDVLPSHTLCYAVGWGKIRDTHLFGQDVLREAKVPLVDRRKCQSAFDYEITVNQMCAGYRRGGVDTCAGDSGGPLMCEIEKNGEKRWYVYGVTSFGEGCGDRGKYGIYTRVSNFARWIQTTVSKSAP